MTTGFAVLKYAEGYGYDNWHDLFSTGLGRSLQEFASAGRG